DRIDLVVELHRTKLRGEGRARSSSDDDRDDDRRELAADRDRHSVDEVDPRSIRLDLGREEIRDDDADEDHDETGDRHRLDRDALELNEELLDAERSWATVGRGTR